MTIPRTPLQSDLIASLAKRHSKHIEIRALARQWIKEDILRLRAVRGAR